MGKLCWFLFPHKKTPCGVTSHDITVICPVTSFQLGSTQGSLKIPKQCTEKGVKSLKFTIDLHQVCKKSPPKNPLFFMWCPCKTLKPFKKISTSSPNPTYKNPPFLPHGSFRWQHSQAGHRRGSSTATSDTTTDTGAQSNSKSNAQSYGSSNTNTYTNTWKNRHKKWILSGGLLSGIQPQCF